MPKHFHTNAAASFCTFSDAELDWLNTTADRDTGLALALNTTSDERGHMLYASPLDDRHSLFPWCILATPTGVTVEKILEVPSYMDQIQVETGPAVPFASLRAALGTIAAEHHGAISLAA